MHSDAIRDLFSAFRPVSVRRMFGGAGLYVDGVMFGLLVDDVIYLKVDGQNEPDFDRENLPPFSYRRRDGTRVLTSYRRMPERLYDDADGLAEWAQRALAAALRASASKSSRRRKRNA